MNSVNYKKDSDKDKIKRTKEDREKENNTGKYFFILVVGFVEGTLTEITIAYNQNSICGNVKSSMFYSLMVNPHVQYLRK